MEKDNIYGTFLNTFLAGNGTTDKTKTFLKYFVSKCNMLSSLADDPAKYPSFSIRQLVLYNAEDTTDITFPFKILKKATKK
jgi:hypothetical protein